MYDINIKITYKSPENDMHTYLKQQDQYNLLRVHLLH